MRTKIINCLNGIWAAFILMAWFMTSDSMVADTSKGEHIEQWQYTLFGLLAGVLCGIPQIGFNWIQSGHPWNNDKGEILRAMILGVITCVTLSFLNPAAAWYWYGGIILLFNLALWKWGGKIFKA